MARCSHRQYVPQSPAYFAGRDRELDHLSGCFSHASNGSGSLVLISGPAGIGKTTLVQTFLESLDDQPLTVLSGACIDLTATPAYGLWLEVMASYPSSYELPAIPDVLIPGTGMGEVTSQAGLFEVAAQFVVETADVQPLIILLEDLHWGDPASLGMLHYMARQLPRHRIMIIATYRSEEVEADHPLFKMLPALSREPATTRLELQPIDLATQATLLVRNYGLSSGDRERLVECLNLHAEGNPLYFWELLRDFEGDGTLRYVRDRWLLGDLSRIRVPSMLIQMIEPRLDRVLSHQRPIIETAAIVGTTVDIDLWQRVAEIDDNSLDEVIDLAMRAHLLLEGSSETSVAFSHAIIRQAIYQRTSLMRRRRTHRRIAELLIETGETNESTIAHHLKQAGDSRAADWLIAAGERAQRTYALQAAAERFSEAAELLVNDESRQNERGWLFYRAARALRFSDVSRGLEYFEEAGKIGKEVNDDVLTAYAIVDRGYLHGNLGSVRKNYEFVLVGNQAIDALPDDHFSSYAVRNWVADVVLRSPHSEMEEQGFLDRLGGRFNPRRSLLVLISAIVGLIEESIDAGEAHRDQLAAITNPDHHILAPYADLCSGLGVAYSHLGKPDQAENAFAEARAALQQLDHRALHASITYWALQHFAIPFRLDHPAERRELAAQADKAARESTEALATGSESSMTNFALLWLEGDWDRARNHAAEGRSVVFQENRKHTEIALGHIARARGEYDTAWDHVFRSLPDGVSTEHLDVELHVAFETQKLAAMTALDQQEYGNADQWIRIFENWLNWSGAVRGQSELELLRSRWYKQTGDSNRAMEFAKKARELTESPRQPMPLIRALRQLGGLHLLDKHYDRALDYLRESVSLADACVVPYEQALSMLSLAEALIKTGDQQRASSLLHAAWRTFESLGALPALDCTREMLNQISQQSVTSTIGLTRRETDVLRLLSQGKQDPEIAEELFISRRTVNTHLSSIYRKLNVKNRTAAAVAARELELM